MISLDCENQSLNIIDPLQNTTQTLLKFHLNDMKIQILVRGVSY